MIWKDVRLVAPALMTAVFLFVASYVSIFLLTRSMTPGPFPWFDAMVVGLHFCQWSMVIAAALIGGIAFASEREDGSYRFLYSLPIPRRDAAISKFVVALIVFECLWILLALAGHVIEPLSAMNTRAHLPGAASPSSIAACSFLVLGASWCWSALVTKPVLAAISGLVTALITMFLVYAICRSLAPLTVPPGIDQIAPWTWPLGLAGFAVGANVYYAEDRDRRVLGGRSNSRAASSDSVLRLPKRAHPHRALLWKDWRLSQTILLAGVLTLVLPYAFPVLVQWRGEGSLEAFAVATTQTLWLSCIVFAIWGGYIVSAERGSQTDRFLQGLPIRNASITGSRLLLTFVPALIIFLSNIGAMLALHMLTFRQSPVDEPVEGFYHMSWPLLVFQANSLMFAMPTFGMPLVCFGVAWFGSISLKRPFLGIGLGAAAPGLVLIIWLSFITLVDDGLRPIQAGLVFLVAGILASLFLLALGYTKLRGSEPT